MARLVRSIALASAVIGAAALAQSVSFHQPARAHSDGHAFAAGEPGDPQEPFRVIEIAMTDRPGTMTYSPNRIDVRKDEQIKFVLRNTGHLAHEFLLDSFENNARHKIQMEKNPEMEHDDPNGGARVEPKKGAEILWRFTSARREPSSSPA